MKNNKTTKTEGARQDFHNLKIWQSTIYVKRSPKTHVKISIWSNIKIKSYDSFELLFWCNATRPSLESKLNPLVHKYICKVIYLVCLPQILIKL